MHYVCRLLIACVSLMFIGADLLVIHWYGINFNQPDSNFNVASGPMIILYVFCLQ